MYQPSLLNPALHVRSGIIIKISVGGTLMSIIGIILQSYLTSLANAALNGRRAIAARKGAAPHAFVIQDAARKGIQVRIGKGQGVGG